MELTQIAQYVKNIFLDSMSRKRFFTLDAALEAFTIDFYKFHFHDLLRRFRKLLSSLRHSTRGALNHDN